MDQILEVLDAVVGEGVEPLHAWAIDGQAAVLRLQLIGDVHQPVGILAEHLGNAHHGVEVAGPGHGCSSRSDRQLQRTPPPSAAL